MMLGIVRVLLLMRRQWSGLGMMDLIVYRVRRSRNELIQEL
jgi:hypothetical protein